MLDKGPIAISLPARELAGVPVPGSVFEASALADVSFSEPLRRALGLVKAAAAIAGATPVFVARPEIFAHGEALAWLQRRLGPTRRHLCFSDGTTLRPIHGLSNHVFFYGLGRRSDFESLERLLRRTPELFGSLASQINTALKFGAFTPETEVIEGASLELRSAACFQMAYDIFSPEDGLTRTLRTGPRSQLPRGFAGLTYVLLTETCLCDVGFSRWLASELEGHWRTPANALVLRLPDAILDSNDVADRVRGVFASIHAGRARAPISPAPHIWLVDGDLSPTQLGETSAVVDCIAPDSFDFWRWPGSAYRVFTSLSVRTPVERRLSGDFESVIEALTGLRPRIFRDQSLTKMLA